MESDVISLNGIGSAIDSPSNGFTSNFIKPNMFNQTGIFI